MAHANAAAQPLSPLQNAFYDLERVSVTASPSAPTEAYTRSASAYIAKLTIPTTSATNDALQAGGTRKKRDRVNRRWKPGGRTETIEHQRRQREEHEQRRREREQQGTTRALSKTQPLVSLLGNARQAGGGRTVDRCEKVHNAHDAEPYQEQENAHPATLGALDPSRYSSTARTRLRVKGPTVEGSGPSLPPSNPLVSCGFVPERGRRERFGSASSCQRSTAAKAPGGGSKTTKTAAGVAVAIAPFSFSPRQRFGGLAS